MTYNLTDEVKAIGSFHFEGNIIPMEWFNHIKLPNNKPDTISIILLSDIIYWYRPTTIRDEQSGKIIGYRKKFKSDLLQKSYKELEDLFGFSSKQIRESFIRLEGLGILQRVFRTIESNGTKISNVMFIKIFPSAIEKIINNFHPSIQDTPSLPTGDPLFPQKERPTSPQGKTNTKTTTKTTTNNSLSYSLSSKSNKTSSQTLLAKSTERENEMLKIWNNIVEGNKNEITLTPRRSNLLIARLKDSFHNDISKWKEFCQKIVSSKFLMGEVTNFKINLDWSLKKDAILKIMENNYGIGDRALETENIENKRHELIAEIEKSNDEELWKKIQIDLLKAKGVAIFKSWFSKNTFMGYNDGVVEIKSFSKFGAIFINQHYFHDIETICSKNIEGFKELIIIY